MYFIGIDHHKMTDYVTVVKGDGSVCQKRRLDARPETLRRFLAAQAGPYEVGIEACYGWEYVADIVEEMGGTIRVAHPLLLKAFARKHKRNDKIDSVLIAQLLRRGDLPVIAHPPKAARAHRDVYRQRMDLVRRRSSHASRAKAWADRHGFQLTVNLSTLKGIEALGGLAVGNSAKVVQQSYVEALTFLYHEIRRVEAEIKRVTEANRDARLVQTIPGMGPYLALLIASEVFDIGRFATSRRFVAYAGLAPGSWSSAGRVYRGRLCPNANRYLRWAFGEAVTHFRKTSSWADRKYQRLKRAKGWKTARIAIARHIAVIAYHLLRERRAYQADAPQRPER